MDILFVEDHTSDADLALRVLRRYWLETNLSA